jgi:hypothetical protein
MSNDKNNQSKDKDSTRVPQDRDLRKVDTSSFEYIEKDEDKN